MSMMTRRGQHCLQLFGTVISFITIFYRLQLVNGFVPSYSSRFGELQSSSVVNNRQYNNSYISNCSNNRALLLTSRLYSTDANKQKTREPPYPKIGDIVRYTDLDGGKADGQVLVGKIALIQPVLGSQEWLLEIAELEDVGGGYFAEYPMRERRWKRALRKLPEVAPVMASYVRSADAFKVPTDENGKPRALFPTFKIEGYSGPEALKIDTDVVQADGERYGELKRLLLRDAAIAGAVGTIIAQLAYGTDEAVIYALGAAAGVGYLFFLSLKTDTVGSTGAKFGSNLSNLRFALPLFVLLGVAIKNISAGSAATFNGGNYLSTVTKEQFGAAMFGFLTYRIPLFLRQLQPVVSESALEMLPGSAGLAMQIASGAAGKDTDELVGVTNNAMKTILLVSGPPGSGKTSLVQKLISEGEGRFIEPKWTDKSDEGPQFEVMEDRGMFLAIKNRRYGLTVDSVLNAANPDEEQVVVIDADVELAKKISEIAGTRVVGVWVGLDSLEKIEERTQAQIESGELLIPSGDTSESLVRSRVKDIVRDIEYGVVSGVFEFTILNDDFDESVKQLKAAAEYCFK